MRAALFEYFVLCTTRLHPDCLVTCCAFDEVGLTILYCHIYSTFTCARRRHQSEAGEHMAREQTPSHTYDVDARVGLSTRKRAALSRHSPAMAQAHRWPVPVPMPEPSAASRRPLLQHINRRRRLAVAGRRLAATRSTRSSRCRTSELYGPFDQCGQPVLRLRRCAAVSDERRRSVSSGRRSSGAQWLHDLIGRLGALSEWVWDADESRPVLLPNAGPLLQ